MDYKGKGVFFVVIEIDYYCGGVLCCIEVYIVYIYLFLCQGVKYKMVEGIVVDVVDKFVVIVELCYIDCYVGWCVVGVLQQVVFFIGQEIDDCIVEYLDFFIYMISFFKLNFIKLVQFIKVQFIGKWNDWVMKQGGEGKKCESGGIFCYFRFGFFFFYLFRYSLSGCGQFCCGG